MTGRRQRLGRAAAIAALALGLGACGDGEGDDSDAEESGLAASVTITGVDHGYQGVLPSVAKDTQLVFTNASETEAHELALYRIDDDEDRPLEELVTLSDEESRELITFEGVSVATPGQVGTVVRGDLLIDETGRYALVCFVPTGADPQAYLAWAEDPAEHQRPTGGPEHFTMGMYAELLVE